MKHKDLAVDWYGIGINLTASVATASCWWALCWFVGMCTGIKWQDVLLLLLAFLVAVKADK